MKYQFTNLRQCFEVEHEVEILDQIGGVYA